MDRLEVLEREEVYRGRTVNLFVETLSYRGRKFRREVVRHPGAVAMLTMTREGRILLERQYRHPIGKWIWEIPAGTLEEGEGPEECAVREVEEETGYRVEKVEKLGGCYLAPGYSDEFIHLFFVRLGEKGKADREIGELIELSEFTLEEVLKMVERGEIEDAKTCTAIFLAKLRGNIK